MDMTDVLNFSMHHLNEDGKECFASLNNIKSDMWTLFVKYDITVQELIDTLKDMSGKISPIVQHCPKIGLDY